MTTSAKIFLGFLLGVALPVYGATLLFPTGGGTGIGTQPTYGQILVGNVGGTYTLTATSSLGILGGTGTATTSFAATFPITLTSDTANITYGFGGLSTSSDLTAGQVLYATGVNTLASTPTTTVSCAGSVSCSVFNVFGSSPFTITGTDNTASTTLLEDDNTFSGDTTFSGALSGINWNDLDDPDGNINLSMGGYTTQFSMNSGATFRWVLQGTTAGNIVEITQTGNPATRADLLDINGTDAQARLVHLTGTPGEGYLVVSTNETSDGDIFVVDDTGMVGVGTTSPYAKLSVNGETVAAFFTATTSTESVFPLANITKISNLTSNGFVKTGSGDGTLSVDTTTYESGLTAGDGLTRTLNDFDCDTANGSTLGCLTAADWTTFNNKQDALISGTNIKTVFGTSLLGSGDVGTAGIAYGGTATTTGGNTGGISFFNGTYFTNLSTLAFNTATSLFTTPNASTTGQFSAASQTFYIDANGRIQAKDTTNNWPGVLSPTRAFALQTATTTTWTATTSAGYVPYLTMPFAGTLRDVSCTASTSAAFLGIAPLINETPTAPSYFVSSSTPGIILFTSANTFSRGDSVSMLVGTTTTDSNANSVSCTFSASETY